MVLGLTVDGADVLAQGQRSLASQTVASAGVGGSTPTYLVLGVPFRTGSLYPGNENDAQAYRDASLIGHLSAAGCKVTDGGDLAIPSYLPHHSVPPIRNWPGPQNRLGYRQRKGLGDAAAARANPSPDWM